MSRFGEEDSSRGSDELSDSSPQSPTKQPSRKRRKAGKSPGSAGKRCKSELSSPLSSSDTAMQLPRSNTKDSGIVEGTDEDSTPFRHLSRLLDSESDAVRQTPPQMLPSDLGSPQKIWSLLCRKDELFRRNPKFLENHRELHPQHRTLLLDWIMEVCNDRKMHRETFHLCVDYIDRYLAKATSPVGKDHIQLIGSAALVIASKMEEIYPPKIEEIADFTDGSCTAEQICIMEEIMLQVLDWSCNPVTAIHWLALYLQLMSANDHIVAAAQRVQLQQKQHKIVAANRTITDWCRTPVSTTAKVLKTVSVHEHQADLSTDSIDSDYLYEGHDSYSEGHIYPDRQYDVPKMMRDEFVRLAKILDLCLLTVESLNFSYSELAAAVVLCCYEPEHLVYQVTGFRADQLVDAFNFVQPFMKVCERLEPTGTSIPFFEDVPRDDLHNIQTHIEDSGAILTEVEKLRRESEQRRKAVDKSAFRARKRKLVGGGGC
ncbi:CRE-CYE-1 protein [Aphelenchoides avenae]|nr:CRE-CYE-1 protein [Aphelenchus avenae]